ncbi:hypothetical protein ACLOAV_010758 [Pseudogymnoascus australis]
MASHGQDALAKSPTKPRGGRPRQYTVEEARARELEKQKLKRLQQRESRDSKASLNIPKTLQFIPYHPPPSKPTSNLLIPTVKDEQELHTFASKTPPSPSLQQGDAGNSKSTQRGRPAANDIESALGVAFGEQGHNSYPPDTVEVAAILSTLTINSAVPLRDSDERLGHISGSDGEDEQSPIVSDAFEHSLWCEDSSEEDHTYGTSDVVGSNSSLRVVQSPSLSLLVGRELRNDAMIIKSESSSSSPNNASYFTDSHSNSDKEEEEERDTIAAAHAASQASFADSLRNGIALQLATQLYAFQGCTQDQHEEQDRQHRKHHQQVDVDSHCSSFAEIVPIIEGRGIHHTMPPLPDVLSDPEIMRPGKLPRESCASAFEGTIPLGDGYAGEAPKNLCLSEHHSQSRTALSPEVTYDIDSICGVADSLAVARLGIQWIPKSFPILNIVKDIHLALPASYKTRSGRVTSRYMPVHNIPHYCFGQLEGMESVKVYIFFPNLRLNIDYDHTNFLTRKEDEDWLDLILAPCLEEVIKSPSILQHFPLSSATVRTASLASSQETFSLKSSSREQIISRSIEPEYLGNLWSAILRRIEHTPSCHHFSDPIIFFNAKNTKLKRMMDSPPKIYTHWQERWNYVTDSRFYHRQRIDMHNTMETLRT